MRERDYKSRNEDKHSTSKNTAVFNLRGKQNARTKKCSTPLARLRACPHARPPALIPDAEHPPNFFHSTKPASSERVFAPPAVAPATFAAAAHANMWGCRLGERNIAALLVPTDRAPRVRRSGRVDFSDKRHRPPTHKVLSFVFAPFGHRRWRGADRRERRAAVTVAKLAAFTGSGRSLSPLVAGRLILVGVAVASAAFYGGRLELGRRGTSGVFLARLDPAAAAATMLGVEFV